MDLNRITLIGRLTHEPKLKEFNKKKCCQLGVATNYQYRGAGSSESKEQPSYHNVIAWGRLAEICFTYLQKGRRVYVEGRLKYNKWKDKEENLHIKTEIVADNVIMLDSKNKEQEKIEIKEEVL